MYSSGVKTSVMKKYIIGILLGIIFYSCEERVVQLPETDLDLITDVRDNSPIYIFYSEEHDSAEFNRNNMISTTNWLVNIDKRLRLHQIYPHLRFLQEKRNKDGFHKNENAKNYFSCSNPEIQNLSFLEFTEIMYDTIPIVRYLSSSSDVLKNPQIFIDFKSFNDIEIGKNFSLTKTRLNELENELKELSKTDSLSNICFFNFNGDLSFQEYIKIKSKLLQIKDEKLDFFTTEFIYK